LQQADPEWVLYFPGWWNMEEVAPQFVDYVLTNYRTEAGLEWEGRQAQLMRRVR
jgi:hypothetical protein